VPELPEVEVLVRHLNPLLSGKTIREVQVRRKRVLEPTSIRRFTHALKGATFAKLTRRGKFLVFTLAAKGKTESVTLVGHLGMTGRMYLQSSNTPLAKHAAVVLSLGKVNFIFEDTRYFGRLTLDTSPLSRLGAEPLGFDFTVESFAVGLRRSAQAVKVKLLDQSLVAGIGNIYASEALFQAGVLPTTPANRLRPGQVARLWGAIRKTLSYAIKCGSMVPLSFSGSGKQDGLFYFGRAAEPPDFYTERLRVYDRHNKPCLECGTPIRRLVQAARSTYYCPQCQTRR
jgi:formamidopyrimidine-DNA glycosylase